MSQRAMKHQPSREAKREKVFERYLEYGPIGTAIALEATWKDDNGVWKTREEYYRRFRLLCFSPMLKRSLLSEDI